MVKRSIEQNPRIENFEARNGNYGRNAVCKNQETKQRERTLGDCWQWKANGQCSKGDTGSFRHDINKFAKTTQPNLPLISSTRQTEGNASRTKSRKSPSGRLFRLLLQGLPQMNLHQFILWKMASCSMLVLQVGELMQIWGKVLSCASPGGGIA